MGHQEVMTTYLANFIQQLVHGGIKHVVISPGSRSTPIAMLMVEHPELNVYIDIDERSAAFFALGMAKETREPVVLLCTSGTAAANYYPAVVEANISRVPLIVLTADRPHELRDVGAPQAINQIHLYGEHVKWFMEMPLPEDEEEVLNFVRQCGARAVATSAQVPAGPVHLNFPLREPLVPLLEPSPFEGLEDQHLFIDVIRGKLNISDSQVEQVVTQVEQKEKGLIICGPIDYPELNQHIVALSEKTGYPIIADPLSQLRSCGIFNPSIIDNYDSILKDQSFNQYFVPEVIIRFGAMPVSKPLTLLLKNAKNIIHYIIDGENGWRDPIKKGTTMVHSDEIAFCQKMDNQLKDRRQTKWTTMWQQLNEQTRSIVVNAMEMENALDEGKVVTELVKFLPEYSTIFVGNSMPIRDVDTFFHVNGRNIRILANRGANGIDGVVSSAIGASVNAENVYLLIGDLSFFHDFNGLLAAKMYQLNIRVILINNNGGGIFSFLPQAKEAKNFELLFGTPTNLSFEHGIAMYDGHYTKVHNWEQFRQAIADSTSSQGIQVIEVPTNRQKNVESHRKMWKKVSQEMNEYFRGEK